MLEDPFAIRTNIAHYQALLRLEMDEQKRRTIQRLLAEAQQNLAAAQALNKER
jgi:hypothetical protein